MAQFVPRDILADWVKGFDLGLALDQSVVLVLDQLVVLALDLLVVLALD